MSSIPRAQKVTFCTILKNITKTNIILTFLSLIKIHLEKSQNTFVARLRRNGRAALKVSHVCGRFRFFFWPSRSASIYQPQSARHVYWDAHIFALRKKVLVALAPLTNSTKHIVRPQRRCSCEIDGTSAVPLLRIHETSVNSS